MTRKYYHEGEVFGRLFVKEYKKGGNYSCICDCGNDVVVNGNDLRKGRVKSCGCLKKEQELDIIGQKFNKLTVLERVGKTDGGRYLFNCLCDCGISKIYEGRYVKSGKVKSCGNHIVDAVREANTTHGDTGTRLYQIYRSMLKRCYNPNNDAYLHYGGRGIKVSSKWLDENGYANFKEWSLANGYNENLTIDRINNDGNYSPNNCRWATYRQQSLNRQDTIYIRKDGEIKTLKEWCDELNISYDAAWKRIFKYGYKPEKALSFRLDRVKNREEEMVKWA